MSANAAEIAFWNGDAGSRWVTLQERIDAAFSPITAAVLERADPRPGEAVLDIGCGSGETVLALARRVGPQASVLGVDVSEPMLTLARRRAQAARLSNVKFVQADASNHELGAHSVDLAFSRFGVMFFQNPVHAFATIRRALRSGARLTFVCWRSLAENEWFRVPLQAATPHVPAQPEPDPQAPGPLSFANPDRVLRILREANFTQIDLQPFDSQMSLGTRASALDFMLQLGPVSRLLAVSDPHVRPNVASALDDALREHEGPQGVLLGAGVWLVSARL